jgi:toxin ParE1/3/4
MAKKLEWTDFALRDVDAIAEYISRDSSRYAAQVVNRIRQKTHGLLRFPERAAIVLELNDPSIRETVVSSYRIIYQVSATSIRIMRVIHGARDFSTAWKEKPPKKPR